MPVDVIEHAKALVSSENTMFEDVIDRLEESRKDMENQRSEALALKREAEAEIEKAKEMKADIKRLREKELENAKAQAIKLTDQAKREAYALLEELERLKKEQSKQKDAAEMARRARALMMTKITFCRVRLKWATRSFWQI